jgi:uncharacterized membrane protein
VFFGVWGALTEIPEKHLHPPFPATLGYAVWSLTMVPCALIALRNIGWKLERDTRSISYGCAVGFTGAVGQLVLFWALLKGPAYLIFPIICLSPVVTIVLSLVFLKERVHVFAGSGIVLSLIAIFLLSIGEPERGPVSGYGWLFLTILVFLMWGVQAYYMKSSATAISPECLFFYMTATAVVVAPIALLMTNFRVPINWRLQAVGLTALIQLLNSVGALLLIYAIRAGKAVIVVPMINGLYPLITILLSLMIYRRVPERPNLAGIVLALMAVLLMTYDEVTRSPEGSSARDSALSKSEDAMTARANRSVE